MPAQQQAVDVSGYFMKRVLTYMTVCLLSTSLLGQTDSLSKQVLYRLIRNEQKDGQITYTDRLGQSTIAKINKYLAGTQIRGYDRTANKIVINLSNTEQKSLRSNLQLLKTFRWTDSMFAGSSRIPVDSMWQQITKKNQEFADIYRTALQRNDSSVLTNLIGDRVTYCNTFQFSPLIFMRNKKLFAFYILRLCGGSCGIEDLSIYKLNDGQYKKWLTITGGAF